LKDDLDEGALDFQVFSGKSIFADVTLALYSDMLILEIPIFISSQFFGISVPVYNILENPASIPYMSLQDGNFSPQDAILLPKCPPPSSLI